MSPFELKLQFVVVICTYRITDVKPANGGVYRCTAHTNTGSYDEDYVLAIQGKINELLHCVNHSCVSLHFIPQFFHNIQVGDFM
jgi:hypothetical protein